MLAETGVIDRPLKRRVANSSRRRGLRYLIPTEDIIVFRHPEARTLREACVFLRWEVVSDTVAEANNVASW
jgi:hypothetical protein